MELRVAARELDRGGAMLCLLRCPASEDDIDSYHFCYLMGEYLKMFSWVSHLYQQSIRIKFTMFCSLGSVP